jgi:hypothetical protein
VATAAGRRWSRNGGAKRPREALVVRWPRLVASARWCVVGVGTRFLRFKRCDCRQRRRCAVLPRARLCARWRAGRCGRSGKGRGSCCRALAGRLPRARRGACVRNSACRRGSLRRLLPSRSVGRRDLRSALGSLGGTRLQRLGGRKFGLRRIITGFQLRRMPIGSRCIRRAISLHESIAPCNQQLLIVGFGLQSVIARCHIRQACAAELIPLELRALCGLCQTLDVRLLRHQAAHVAELAC